VTKLASTQGQPGGDKGDRNPAGASRKKLSNFSTALGRSPLAHVAKMAEGALLARAMGRR